MAGFLLCNAILIGGLMVLGGRLFPSSEITWFMSDANAMMAWREVVLAGLLLMALVRQYYDNRLARVVWALAAVPLLWAGYQYFLDNTALIFDAFFLMLAGVSFAIAALQTADEPQPIVRPIVFKAWNGVVILSRRLETRMRLLNHQSTLHVVNWQNMQNTEHRMLLRRSMHV